jgi:hypothetical protein
LEIRMSQTLTLTDDVSVAASAGIENIAASDILASRAGADCTSRPTGCTDGLAAGETIVATAAVASLTCAGDASQAASGSDGLAAGDTDMAGAADVADQEVAYGENTTVANVPRPASDPYLLLEGPAVKPPTAQEVKQQYYREQLAAFKASAQQAASTDGDARAIRIGLLVGTATLVREKRFDVEAFCSANGLPCTKATRANPDLAVIRAALPNSDRKLASKLGIALSWAVRASGGLAQLPGYLREHSVEECVTDARAAKRGRRPARRARLVIIGAPSALAGRVTVTIDVVHGVGSFISQVRSAPPGDTPAVPMAPRNGVAAGELLTEIAQAAPDEPNSPGTRTGAHEVHRNGGDAAGEASMPA